MIKNFFSAMLVATVFAMAPAPALASNGQVALKGDVKVEKTVTENGETRSVFEDPKVVVPGDRLLFSTSYVNTGETPVKNFVVTNPLPPAVRIAEESATALEVSVDGGKTWGRLTALMVGDGQGGQRPAQAGDVTHVHWVISEIAPHGQGQVEYRAIVR